MMNLWQRASKGPVKITSRNEDREIVPDVGIS
jgi:hypothetical protein